MAWLESNLHDPLMRGSAPSRQLSPPMRERDQLVVRRSPIGTRRPKNAKSGRGRVRGQGRRSGRARSDGHRALRQTLAAMVASGGQNNSGGDAVAHALDGIKVIDVAINYAGPASSM